MKYVKNTLKDRLIDDAVGSGATLQETARKIKDRGIAKKVYGVALVGSIKGFEVISEVWSLEFCAVMIVEDGV